MELVPTRIPDVVLVKPRVFGDQRGYFLETWHETKFLSAGLGMRFVQDNHSRSAQWTLRGMHFQIEQPQGKLVRVARGAVFDVAVDLRRSSPTWRSWRGSARAYAAPAGPAAVNAGNPDSPAVSRPALPNAMSKLPRSVTFPSPKEAGRAVVSLKTFDVRPPPKL